MLRALALVFVAAPLASGPALPQTPYDGQWIVTVITKTGSCEPSSKFPLTVLDGRVSGSGEVSGSIGYQGIVRVVIRGVYASGHLNGNTGLGKWSGASGGIACSGRWKALRQ
jgi:hypothetical protein